MWYIFMDESWCLGFDFNKEKTSKYLLLSTEINLAKG